MPRQNSKRRFGMAVSANVLEILIYEEIGADFWSYDGGITTSSIAAKLKAAGTFDRISVRINSPGGNCYDGVGIYNLLRAQSKPIDVYVDGFAASAASLIAMAGDTISVGAGATIMIHNASIFAYGEAADFRKVANDLDIISVTAGEIYVKRTGQTPEKIKELMDAETWLSGAEAIALGFATEVIELQGEQSTQARALAQEFVQAPHFQWFKELPKSFARISPKSKILAPRTDAGDDCTCPCQPCLDGDCENCETLDCTYTGCTCPQHAEEMSSGVDPELEFYRRRLALHQR